MFCTRFLEMVIRASLAAVLFISYGHVAEVSAETVKDFRDPEGRLFEDYRYFPPALVAEAKKLFDKGACKDTDLYRFIQNEYGYQSAEDFRWWWIRSEMLKYQGGKYE